MRPIFSSFFLSLSLSLSLSTPAVAAVVVVVVIVVAFYCLNCARFVANYVTFMLISIDISFDSITGCWNCFAINRSGHSNRNRVFFCFISFSMISMRFIWLQPPSLSPERTPRRCNRFGVSIACFFPSD